MTTSTTNAIPCVMVCVTRQRACERLIKHGAEIALIKKQPLVVVHVARNGDDLLGNVSDEGKALDFLFGIAKHYNAEMVMLRSDHVVDTLCGYAQQSNVTTLIMGESRTGHTAVKGIDREINTRLPSVEIITLGT